MGLIPVPSLGLHLIISWPILTFKTFSQMVIVLTVISPYMHNHRINDNKHLPFKQKVIKIILIKKFLCIYYLSLGHIPVGKKVFYKETITHFGTFDVLRHLFKVSVQFS